VKLIKQKRVEHFRIWESTLVKQLFSISSLLLNSLIKSIEEIKTITLNLFSNVFEIEI
jgi:hypothetical protein